MICGKMAKTFRQALLDAIATTGDPLLQVAEKSGVSYPQLQKVKARPNAKTNVEDAVKVARYFGFTVNEFLDDALAEDRIQQARVWRELTEAEREIVRDLARVRDAQARGEG